MEKKNIIAKGDVFFFSDVFNGGNDFCHIFLFCFFGTVETKKSFLKFSVAFNDVWEGVGGDFIFMMFELIVLLKNTMPWLLVELKLKFMLHQTY